MGGKQRQNFNATHGSKSGSRSHAGQQNEKKASMNTSGNGASSGSNSQNGSGAAGNDISANAATPSHILTTAASSPRVVTDTSVRMQVSVNIPEGLSGLSNILNLLRICREISVDWNELLNPADQVAGGQNITELINSFPPYFPSSIAAHIFDPKGLAVIAHVKDESKEVIVNELRKRIFGSLVHCADNEAEDTSGTDAAFPSSKNASGEATPATSKSALQETELLTALIENELISAKDAIGIIEELLKEKSTQRVAVDAIGVLVEKLAENEGFLKSLTVLQSQLQSFANDPLYEGAISYISRNARWNLPGPQLRFVKEFPVTHSKSIVSTAYFSTTDELVSGGRDGSVAVWGAPSYSEAPSAKFNLGPGYIPVAMDALTRGRTLCVAGVATTPDIPVVRFFHCNEKERSSSNWKLVETIEREESKAITCLRRMEFRTNQICIAEFDDRGHSLTFFSGDVARKQQRIRDVHTKHVTVITPGTDGQNVLFSGSRDCAVKMWDTRHGGQGSTSSFLAHTDTITTLHVADEHLCTAGLDGRVCLWDVRRPKKPICEKRFSAPVLKLAPMNAQRSLVAVSTPHGLSLLTTGNLVLEDTIGGVCFPELRANHDGHVLFACSTTVQMFSVTQ